MGFMKVNKEVVEKAGGSAFIGASNIYEVTLNAVTVDINEKGARTVGLYVNVGGTDQMLYGALPLDLYDNSQELDNNVACLQRLAVIAGLEDIEDPEEATLPIGKGGADKDVMVLPGFEDVECKIWMKQEFYKSAAGKIGENRLLKDVFTMENASADEIINETEAGVKYTKREQYFTDTKYGTQKAPLTEQEVQDWVDAGRPDTSGSGGGSKPASSRPKASFGKR